MSTKQKRVFWPSVIICALGLSVLAFASARKLPVRVPKARGEKGTQNPIAAANANGQDYVRMGKLWPQLRWNLKALGDRLEKPGKERLTITGTLNRAGDTQPLPVLLILQFSDHLRLETQGLGPHQIITFNGKTAGKAGGLLDQSDEDLIESLVYDTGEHFFSAQAKGRATRALGSRFRLDDGTTPNYSGPFCDIYDLADQIGISPRARQQSKRYLFNSDTLLPERVQYVVGRNGSQVSVEIRMMDWQQVQGQQIARRITRLESNQPVLTLTITSIAISAKVDDRLFD